MVKLTPQMRADFREKGYLVIPNLIDEELVPQGLKIGRGLIEDAKPGWREDAAGPYMGSDLLVSGIGRVPLRGHPVRLFYDKVGVKEVVDQLFRGDLPAEEPNHVQAIATVPPLPLLPTKPHIDGFVIGNPVPHTFSLLVSILVSPQEHEGDGGLFLWPGSHLQIGKYASSHGIEAVWPDKLRERITLADPIQVTAPAGSMVLAHYLLAHATGTNTSSGYAERLYFRLKAAGHDGRWKDTITDPLLEYA